MIDLSVIKFDSRGLVPAVTQDARTRKVLMVAYMNLEALEKTLSTGKAHYFSRSRNSLWFKGETSGNYQTIRAVYYDCDADTVLLMVDPRGPACHTGETTCFFRRLDSGAALESAPPPQGAAILDELFRVLKERRGAPPEKSYVSSLYAKGLEKITAKIGEEASELVYAAAAKERKDIVSEFSDLLFHAMVLLSERGIEMEEVYGELSRRFGISGIEEKASRKKD